MAMLYAGVRRCLLSRAPALRENQVSYWKLDEPSGTWVDSIGSNNLTIVGTVTSVSGIRGNAIQLTAPGSNGLTIADNASLSAGGGGSFTFAGWAWVDTLTGARPIWNKFSASAGQREYQLQVTTTGAASWALSTDGTASVFLNTPAGSVVTGQWHFFATWLDKARGQLGLRVDDKAVVQEFSSNIFDSTSPFRLGVPSGGGIVHDGRIDEVGFWHRVLQTWELDWLWNNRAGRTWLNGGFI